MKYLLALTSICLFFVYGCNHVNNSIQETLHPRNTLPKKIVKKEVQMPDIQKIIDSQVTMANSIIKTHTSQHIEIHVNGQSKQLLANDRELKNAEAALRQLPQYAGKEIFIYQGIHFYDDGSINVMLRHPANPEYVDQYHYKKGQWSAPSPVQLSARDHVESRMVPLDSIRFITAFTLARNYNQKALEVEGAKPVTHVYAAVWDKRIRWYPITINGSRESYSIDFNTNGDILRFNRN